MIEAKYEGEDTWLRIDRATHVGAAEILAGLSGQEPCDGRRIILTRDTRAPGIVFRHRVTAKLIFVVVPLREGS